MPRAASLQDIAATTGYAKSTVSLALRNHPSIPPATCREIQQQAAAMGYRPNPYVSSLMSHLRNTGAMKRGASLAIVNPIRGRISADRGEPIRRRYHAGAARCMAQLGFDVEALWLKEPGMTVRRMDRVIRARGIRGLFVLPIEHDAGHISLDLSHLAAATAGYSIRRPMLHRACCHNTSAITTVLRRLKHLGYRRPGLALSARGSQRVNGLWLAGYLSYPDILRQRENYPPPWVPDKWERNGFQQWLKTSRPDAVISPSQQALPWLKEAGYRIPEDIGFASLNLHPGMEGISGIDQNYERIAEAAVDHIVSQIFRNEYGVPEYPRTTMIESTWIEGSTIRHQAP